MTNIANAASLNVTAIQAFNQLDANNGAILDTIILHLELAIKAAHNGGYAGIYYSRVISYEVKDATAFLAKTVKGPDASLNLLARHYSYVLWLAVHQSLQNKGYSAKISVTPHHGNQQAVVITLPLIFGNDISLTFDTDLYLKA